MDYVGLGLSDSKYVTFRRSELEATLTGLPVAPLLDPIEIKDAVVIRRQDWFASPALASYAAAIAIVLQAIPEEDKRRPQLLAVADYFQRQSELAAEEGWRFPDV